MIRLLFYRAAPVSYRDVAARLGLATGSIGFIRGRCLKRLQRALEKAGLLVRHGSRAWQAESDELIDRAGGLQHRRGRARAFCAGTSELWDAAVVERLYARVVRLARTDLQRADRLAQAAPWMAEKLDDDGCRAQSLRAIGHVQFIARQVSRGPGTLRRGGEAVPAGRDATWTWRAR